MGSVPILDQSLILAEMAGVYTAQVYGRYLAVITATVCVYDHTTSLDLEISTIWTKSTAWTFTKVLYLLVRYGITFLYPASLYNLFATTNSPGICVTSAAFISAFLLLGWIGQGVLCLRVWALYHRSIMICILLVICQLGVMVSTGVIVGLYLSSERIPLPEFAAGTPQITGCALASIPNAYIGTLCNAICETIIVGLTLWKLVPMIRSKRDEDGGLAARLRDSGLIYYLAMLSCLVLYLVAGKVPVLTVPVLSAGPLIAVQCIGCARLIMIIMIPTGNASFKSDETSVNESPETMITRNFPYTTMGNLTRFSTIHDIDESRFEEGSMLELNTQGFVIRNGTINEVDENAETHQDV